VKFFRAILLFSTGILALMIAHSSPSDAASWQWDFENDPAGKPPSGFSSARTGSGRMGRWLVQAEKDAPSGTKVLAQLDTDATSYRFPMAVANSIPIANLRVSVRCKAVSGKVDQACGLVFRYLDEDNYYLTRANALEDNIRFYHVVAGKRSELASWTGRVIPGTWHELNVNLKGDLFEIFWNGKKVIETRDKTFSEAGKIGLWTKADSVTYFDDLTVEAR
jgi:hypothetical protein